MPVLATAIQMRLATPGQVVKVLVTDRGALADIPAWAEDTGNELLGSSQGGGCSCSGSARQAMHELNKHDGAEPDARFTFANGQTCLAWNRTAVALVVAGLAITQLLPPFPGIPGGRHIVGVPLMVPGIVLSLTSYRQWARNQRALRLGQPLPHSNLPRLLTLLVAAVAVTATVLVLVSRGPGL